MPIVTSQLLSRPEQAIEMIADVVQDEAGPLGIEYVGKYDEVLIPRYPAVVVSAGPVSREVHATHTFLVTLRCVLWVYHADLTITHSTRSLEDLELATGLVALLEDDKTWGNRVIFGFVESETPGIVAPRSGRSNPIVGTRIAWEAVSEEMWS